MTRNRRGPDEDTTGTRLGTPEDASRSGRRPFEDTHNPTWAHSCPWPKYLTLLGKYLYLISRTFRQISGIYPGHLLNIPNFSSRALRARELRWVCRELWARYLTSPPRARYLHTRREGKYLGYIHIFSCFSRGKYLKKYRDILARAKVAGSARAPSREARRSQRRARLPAPGTK